MKTRFLILFLAVAYITVPLGATQAKAMECEIVAVKGKKITMQCDKADVEKEKFAVKNKVKIKKIK